MAPWDKSRDLEKYQKNSNILLCARVCLSISLSLCVCEASHLLMIRTSRLETVDVKGCFHLLTCRKTRDCLVYLHGPVRSFPLKGEWPVQGKRHLQDPDSRTWSSGIPFLVPFLALEIAGVTVDAEIPSHMAHRTHAGTVKDIVAGLLSPSFCLSPQNV